MIWRPAGRAAGLAAAEHERDTLRRELDAARGQVAGCERRIAELEAEGARWAIVVRATACFGPGRRGRTIRGGTLRRLIACVHDLGASTVIGAKLPSPWIMRPSGCGGSCAERAAGGAVWARGMPPPMKPPGRARPQGV